MTVLDPRLHAFRPDLADIALSGEVEAARYVEPFMRQCVRGIAPLLAEPRRGARQVSQIRYGEFLDVFDLGKDGFAWAQNRADHYVGYIRAEGALSENIADLSNRIGVLKTFVYAEPDVKSPVLDALMLGSHVGLGNGDGKFVKLMSGGYVIAGHVVPAADVLTHDYVFTAGRLLNAPYLWGGRTPKGIDCSGLVQLALEMASVDCPRDSDMQQETFGKPLDKHWRDVDWKRGDLVFFQGHVGIMTGTDHMIHASGHHMLVVTEPLADAVLARGNDIIAMGRPSS